MTSYTQLFIIGGNLLHCFFMFFFALIFTISGCDETRPNEQVHRPMLKLTTSMHGEKIENFLVGRPRFSTCFPAVRCGSDDTIPHVIMLTEY